MTDMTPAVVDSAAPWNKGHLHVCTWQYAQSLSEKDIKLSFT